MRLEDVLGQEVRAIRLRKDRDHEIVHQRHYMTFSGMSILEPFPLMKQPPLDRLTSVMVPPSMDIAARLATGPNILAELDMNISDIRAKLLRSFFTAYHISKGYAVNYVIGPNENQDNLKEDIAALIGESTEKLVPFNSVLI